jgi:hypothetical protein
VFDIGDKVMIKYYKPGNKETWIRATVSKVVGSKRYECKSSDDKTYVRHVDQINYYNNILLILKKKKIVYIFIH